jgi:hypothetical protein
MRRRGRQVVKAKVCKTFIGGSIPPRASKLLISRESADMYSDTQFHLQEQRQAPRESCADSPLSDPLTRPQSTFACCSR